MNSQVALKEKYPKICVGCKKPFTSKHRDTEYCSKKCKDKVWRNQHLTYAIDWLKAHPEHKIKQKMKEIRQVRNEYKKKWYSQNKTKFIAETIAEKNTYLQSSCEICGGTSKLERHHPDYSEPLVVVTVCKPCHNNIHRRCDF